MPEHSQLSDNQELHQALVYSLRKFFTQSNLKKATIGMSGGIDSALVASLLAEAIGKENVYAVNMPSQFNSKTTKNFAKNLSDELGIKYTILPIGEAVDLTNKQLENDLQFYDKNGKTEKFTLSDLNKENIQARDRGSRLLAGIASMVGGVFTNNGNKTETAFGYCTVDGDLAGAIAPIGDLYKGEVYELSKYIAEKNNLPTLNKIAESLPSAELSAEQNIEEGKGDPFIYNYHDNLVRAFVEFRKNPEDILKMYNNGTLTQELKLDEKIFAKNFSDPEFFIKDLEHKYKLFKGNVFKRVQGQPIIRISRKGFGFDLRESSPSDKAVYTENYQNLKKQLLNN